MSIPRTPAAVLDRRELQDRHPRRTQLNQYRLWSTLPLLSFEWTNPAEIISNRTTFFQSLAGRSIDPSQILQALDVVSLRQNKHAKAEPSSGEKPDRADSCRR